MKTLRLAIMYVAITLFALFVQLPTQASKGISTTEAEPGYKGLLKVFPTVGTPSAGVVSLASGVQYKILASGKGKHPKLHDTAVVRYRGYLLDGTPLEPDGKHRTDTLPLTGVIPGWAEGVQLIKPGGKILLRIPPTMGYGRRAIPGFIPANSVLLYEIELISFKQCRASSVALRAMRTFKSREKDFLNYKGQRSNSFSGILKSPPMLRLCERATFAVPTLINSELIRFNWIKFMYERYWP